MSASDEPPSTDDADESLWPADALLPARYEPPPIDDRDKLALDFIAWLRLNPHISWHSPICRQWATAHGVVGSEWRGFLDRVRCLFADAHQEHTREVVARLVSAAEDLRTQALSQFPEPDLKAAVAAIKIQADLLVPRQHVVGVGVLAPPTAATTTIDDLNRMSSEQLEALAAKRRQREAFVRNAVEAHKRAAAGQ
jgi:hypothetical protein